MFIFRHSYSCADFNGKPLPFINDYWGKHCALITSVDKPSRVRQLKPYPTPPHPTHPTLPYPTLPYPTLPCPALPCPALPCPAQPYPYPTTYPSLPYPQAPAHPHPYPTTPYPINMASLPFNMIFYLIWIRSF